MVRRSSVVWFAVFVISQISALEASAQSTSETGGNTQSYARVYFDKFNPQTAQDLVERIPGFTLEVDDLLRGFGSAAGNVLIDGVRPSSKAGGISEALRRIPADRVERIDVVRSAVGNSEAAGQSVIANIVLADIKTSGRWEGRLQQASDGRVNGFADVSLATELGDWATTTQLGATIDRRPLVGSRVTSDAANSIALFEEEDSPSSGKSVTISSEAVRPAFGGSLRLTGRLDRRPTDVSVQRLGFENRVPDDAPDQFFTLDIDIDNFGGEFGADWTRSLPRDWSLKLLSIVAYSDNEREQTTNTRNPVASSPQTSVFASNQERTEIISRATFARTGQRSFRTEIGAEIAYNRLDSNLTLLTEDADGSSMIDLPAANVTVEEIRGEAFFNLIWRATARWTLEAGVAVESSEILVSGDAANKQSFGFVKPFASISLDAHQGLQFRTEIRRSVGQLGFSDFAASASAADERFLAGNPQLGPDQTTRAAFITDFRAGNGSALNVEVFHEWREDVLEQSRLPSGAFGLANAGSARFWGLSADAALPLSPMIPGGLLELKSNFVDSKFDDSIAGGSRQLSNTDTPDVLITFRQDFAQRRVSWGVSYRPPLSGTFFFVDEESANSDGRFWSAFFETTRFAGLRTRVELTGIGDQNFRRERRLFDPDRSGTFTGSQIISRDRGMFVNLSLSGQF
ncbi:MAG: TonB-dependent receptor plug domain-containing protein [Pseudomonadota bacterium]